MLETKNYLMYQLRSDEYVHCSPVLDGFKWSTIDAEIIARLYENDSLQNRFMRFLNLGYRGMVVSKDDRWITHVWTSTPSSPLPPHLPVMNINEVYWLFNGHTRPEYRGTGILKKTLQLIVNHILQIENAMVPYHIYTDVVPGNLAPRKAVLSMGFKPQGIIHRQQLCMAGHTLLRWGTWNKMEPHPLLDQGGKHASK